MTSNKSDRRRKDYVPKTGFQSWLKPLFEKNALEGKQPSNYTELYDALLKRDVDVSENYVYRIVRGDPETFPNARRPGYEITLAIGSIMGDTEGALKAADWTQQHKPTAVKAQNGEIIRVIEPDSMVALDAYEGLPEPLKQAALEHLRSLNRIAKEGYRARTDIHGKRSDDDENPTGISEDDFAGTGTY